MLRFFSIILLSSLFVSCVQDNPDTDGSNTDGNLKDLQNQVSQLKMDNAMKDSVINESLSFFNEIKANLEAIGIRKDEIRALSENNEITHNDKQWIIEEIRHINFLREENANNLRRMQNQMKENGVKIKELEVMIESLMKDIQWKDEQISMLQGELDNLDKEYSKLFDAYQQQSVQIDQITDELNAVYYAYGSEMELTENGVIEKKNGFMGIGKKMSLKEHFNEKYFTRIDATKKKSITIAGENIRFITYHPQTSYKLENNGKQTILRITDASEFWKISKYLVVIVD